MHVLLVEEDEHLGSDILCGLENDGWTVQWVHDGVAAKSAIERDGFDLMVLDIGPHKRAGLTLLRWLTSQAGHIATLILTEPCEVADRVSALDAGADDCVAKPIDIVELRARLRALQRRALGPASSVLRYGGIEVDRTAQSVTLNGERVALSPKELTILCTLMEQAGKVVPRSRLVRSLYGWGDEVSSNALEVHIHNLRRKVPCGVLLKTVWGVGYTLE
jgi:two-component system, OmpR family, response regulator QseB